MPEPTIEPILNAYDAGELSDDALIEQVAALAEANGAPGALQAAWPTERLPVVRDYYCVRLLGQGASGVVYQAVHLGPEPRMVALKLLRLVAEEETRRFFEREVEVLKALDCPNVARYLDSGFAAGTHFLAMELVHGQPLDEYLAEHTRTLGERLVVFEKTVAAVAQLHQAGVIHRDLKPKHVLVDRHGAPCIVDLGLCAARGEDWPTEIRRTQTRLGRVMGTVKYMSPEQAWGGLIRTDYRADIWALGVMLYEIATDGAYPYSLAPLEGRTPADSLLIRIRDETPRTPHIKDARFAAPLATLIARCLATDPKHRLPSAAQLASDLGRLQTRMRIRTRPLPVRYRLQRLGIGLAIHARSALWTGIIAATLMILFGLVLLGDVHWVTTGDAYSVETQTELIKAAHPHDEIPFAFVAISDETVRAVPAFAASHGIPDVSWAITSWRAVHGQLMERLARARPRLVVWDYYFRTPRDADAAFVRGVRALDEAGAPVVLACIDYDTNGGPQLSPQILEPLGDRVHHGLIVGRDQVKAPGGYVLALQREGRTHPALILTAFGALAHPDCQAEVRWPRRDENLQLRYRRNGTDEYLGVIDDVALSSATRLTEAEFPAKAGDVLALAAYPLLPPERWADNTIAYERLLEADDAELAAMTGGRILVFADAREPTLFTRYDWHKVRYPDAGVKLVPGGYVLTNGIAGLVNNRQKVFRLGLLARSFAILLGAALGGCLLAVPLARRVAGASTAAQHVAMAAVSALAAGAIGLLLLGEGQNLVVAGLCGAALCLALVGALGVEYTRNRRRLPPATV